jgi:hypothetical protein
MRPEDYEQNKVQYTLAQFLRFVLIRRLRCFYLHSLLKIVFAARFLQLIVYDLRNCIVYILSSFLCGCWYHIVLTLQFGHPAVLFLTGRLLWKWLSSNNSLMTEATASLQLYIYWRRIGDFVCSVTDKCMDAWWNLASVMHQKIKKHVKL